MEIDCLERNSIGFAFTIGTSFIACFFIAGMIGYFLDKWLDTRPLWFVIMLFVGLGAGFRNFIVMVMKLDE